MRNSKISNLISRLLLSPDTSYAMSAASFLLSTHAFIQASSKASCVVLLWCCEVSDITMIRCMLSPVQD